jgi:hypothetical protein
MEEESPRREEKGRPGVRFCPYCFMQQFQVSDRIEGSVYCEVCGIDIPVKDLANL